MRLLLVLLLLFFALPVRAVEVVGSGGSTVPSLTASFERVFALPAWGLLMAKGDMHHHGITVYSDAAKAPAILGGRCRNFCYEATYTTQASPQTACTPAAADCSASGVPFAACTGAGTGEWAVNAGAGQGSDECAGLSGGFNFCGEDPKVDGVDPTEYCVGHGGDALLSARLSRAESQDDLDWYIPTEHYSFTGRGIYQDLSTQSDGTWFNSGANGRGPFDSGDPEWDYPVGYTPIDTNSELEFQGAWLNDAYIPGSFVTLRGVEYGGTAPTGSVHANHTIVVYPGDPISQTFCTSESGCFPDSNLNVGLFQHVIDTGAWVGAAHPTLQPTLHWDQAGLLPNAPDDFVLHGFELGGLTPKLAEQGGVDGREIVLDPQTFDGAFDLYSAGRKVSLVGGSDKHGNSISGQRQTLVLTSPSLTRETLMADLLAGHTAALVNLRSVWQDGTGTPRMDFQIANGIMGSTIRTRSEPVFISLHSTQTDYGVDQTTDANGGKCFVVGGSDAEDCVSGDPSAIPHDFVHWEILRNGLIWRNGACETIQLCQFLELIDISQPARYRARVKHTALGSTLGLQPTVWDDVAIASSPIYVEDF